MPKRKSNTQTSPQKKTLEATRREIRSALQELERQLANIRRLKAMQYKLSKLGIRK